uniref:40S ribosomal protein S26 n=1 Tax=Schistosoma curassoni TaxID=6186 RepID=A0A183JTF3_9TREM
MIKQLIDKCFIFINTDYLSVNLNLTAPDVWVLTMVGLCPTSKTHQDKMMLCDRNSLDSHYMLLLWLEEDWIHFLLDHQVIIPDVELYNKCCCLACNSKKLSVLCNCCTVPTSRTPPTVDP